MRAAWALVILAALAGCAHDASRPLTVGTTTTTQEAGLLDVLLPAFERAAGISVRAVVGGTGETIEKARRGDVDLLLTHSPQREQALLDQGIARVRNPVMFNRFLVAGPPDDPARVGEAADAADAFRRIFEAEATFVSRGDQSGTHDKERETWARAGLDPESFPSSWYKETGTGQGSTLLVAHEFRAYVVVDEATLVRFHAGGKATDVVALHEDDPALRNQYAVVQLEPHAMPAPIRHEDARRFAAWLTGPDGHAAIDAFRIQGRQVFFADAGGP